MMAKDFDKLLSDVKAGKGKLYRVVLSEQGKAIYKGGNVPVMKRMLFSFYAKDLRHAEGIYHSRLISVMGSSNDYLFKVVSVK